MVITKIRWIIFSAAEGGEHLCSKQKKKKKKEKKKKKDQELTVAQTMNSFQNSDLN